MSQVRLRFEHSDTLDCARLVPKLYSAARDSCVAADSDMASQAKSFFLQRSYGRVERLLDYSDSLLTLANDSAARIVKRFAAEVGPLKQQASEMLGGAVSKMDSIEKESGRTQEMVALRGRLVSLRILLARADSKLAAGQTVEAAMDYQTVIEQAKGTSALLRKTR